MRAQQPAFDQGGEAVNAWHAVGCKYSLDIAIGKIESYILLG
jgi:hypothetical protein